MFSFILSNGYAQTRLPYSINGKWVFVDSLLNPATKYEYQFILPYIGNEAIVKKKNKYGVIDKNEKTIVEFKYDTIVYNTINYNCKRKNRNTEIPIKGAPTCYSIGCGYGNGRIVPYRIRGRGDWYFEVLFAKKDADLSSRLFDKDFDSTIYYFQAFTDCGNNQIIVAQNRKYGIINYKNEIITPIIYNNIVKHDNSLFEYMLNQKSGFLNYRGEVITPPI